MQSLVSAKDFVPAGSAGNLFGPRPPLEMEVSLDSLKGIRADREWDASCQPFRFPPSLTSIAPGSEADRKGLKTEGTVLHAHVEVEATAPSSCPGMFMPDSVHATFLGHSACDLWIARQQGLECSHCGLFTVEESHGCGEACLVCTNCGINAQDALMNNARQQGLECSHCGLFTVEESHGCGEACLVCTNCGINAQDALMNNEGERRNYDEEFVAIKAIDDRTRLTTSSQPKMPRSKAEVEVFALIEELCDRMGLRCGVPSSAKAIATKFFFALAVRRKQTRVPNLAVAAACVYCASDELGFHRTVKEMLAGAPACEAKHFKSAAAHIKRAVPLLRKPVEPAVLLARFCNSLHLDPETERAAREAFAEAPPTLAARHVSTTLAAAAVARASGLPAKHVAAATGAAASTIQSVLREWSSVGGGCLPRPAARAPLGGGLAHTPPPPPPTPPSNAPSCSEDASMHDHQHGAVDTEEGSKVKDVKEEEAEESLAEGSSAGWDTDAFPAFSDEEEVWPTEPRAEEEVMDCSFDDSDWGDALDWGDAGGDGCGAGREGAGGGVGGGASASDAAWEEGTQLKPPKLYLSARRLSELVGGDGLSCDPRMIKEEEEEEEEGGPAELTWFGHDASFSGGGARSAERVAGCKRERDELEEEEMADAVDQDEASASEDAAPAPPPRSLSSSPWPSPAEEESGSGLGGMPSKKAMDRQIQAQFKSGFCMNDNSYRRLVLFFHVLREAERHGELSISAAPPRPGAAPLSLNCVVGFRHLRVHRVAEFNARVRNMIERDPEGVWKKANGKQGSGLKLPTAPLYEVLRKIGVRPAGARLAGGLAGEEDRFWRTEWVYKPESMTWKTVERMNKGHEYSPTLSSAVRKQALKARA